MLTPGAMLTTIRIVQRVGYEPTEIGYKSSAFGYESSEHKSPVGTKRLISLPPRPTSPAISHYNQQESEMNECLSYFHYANSAVF